MLSKADLIAFESDIAAEFEAGHIHAPVHLSGGNEDQVIGIFKDVRSQDWVFSTWRSHYHALLKGIPADWLKAEIMAGRSMYICNKEYKFLSSAIVGGILPIALGVAWSIKRQGGTERVWCFVGDMAARTGLCYEVQQYAMRHELPITFINEDNGLSTNTPTGEVWGYLPLNLPLEALEAFINRHKLYYQYKRQWPHVGMGKFITFG